MRKILMLAAISVLMMVPAFAEDSKPEPKATVESLQMQIKERDATIAGLNAWVTTLRHQAQLRAQAEDALAQQVGKDAHDAVPAK